MRKMELSNNPYASNVNLFKKKTITFQEGVTVLVGANGTGKTTLLHLIYEHLQKENIPVYRFDNLIEGGKSENFEQFMFHGETEMAATSLMSSEGENIMLGVSALAKKVGSFIRTGKVKHMLDFLDEEKEVVNERWILLDATDSGLSIDNVIDLKNFFKFILKDTQQSNIETYIVISANEYELAAESNCFDVRNGKYITFNDYNDFREFIIQSRKDKDKRIEDDIAMDEEKDNKKGKWDD